MSRSRRDARALERRVARPSGHRKWTALSSSDSSTCCPSPGAAGTVGLFYALHEEARGEGFATEAARALIELGFGELELARIIATTTFDKIPSLRAMERLGLELIHNRSDEPAWLQVVGVRTP